MRQHQFQTPYSNILLGRWENSTLSGIKRNIYSFTCNHDLLFDKIRILKH